MEVIVSKRCSCCTRVLPVERFRLRTKRGQRVHVAQCDQCEKGREAVRRQFRRMVPRVKPQTPHQRCNVQLDNWRGPVERGQLLARIAA